MFVDKLQKSDKFMKMIQERGAVEDVRDFEIEILSRKQ